MILEDALLHAVRAVTTQRQRSLLTMLGIIIGVWAITTVIAAVGGMNSFVLNEFEKFGATKMWVWGERPRELRGKLDWSDVRLSNSEVVLMRDNATTLARVSRISNLGATVRYGDEYKPGVRVTGIDPDWHQIEQRFVETGRTFSQTDDEEQLQVCLVNRDAIDELRLENGGVGEHVLINDRRFLIVGILESKDMAAMFGGGESRTEIYIPFGTVYKLRDVPWMYVMASMTSPEVADECRAEITFLLRNHRQLPPEWPDTFDMFQLTSELENFKVVSMVLTAAASVLVSISLVVGGIGIMNIMLVSVSERTREIGLRKALGANPLVILVQFLIEAVILCVAGGLIGLIVGQLTTLAIKSVPIGGGMTLARAEIPLWAIILAFGFSATVGIVFGMGPAIKAARLDPIEALRHE
jgi:putative ABC transport system permease protein